MCALVVAMYALTHAGFEGEYGMEWLVLESGGNTTVSPY